jgi:hypothetical protein
MTIETLWRTSSEQCELVFHEFFGYRFKYWRQGALIIDDVVSNRAAALRRAAVLRVKEIRSPRDRQRRRK